MIYRQHNTLLVRRAAWYSKDERYRYGLQILWAKSRQPAMFIGLNPSTATELANDPTLTRCERWARGKGYGGVTMTNLFAFRATKPKHMKLEGDPVGPDNDTQLLRHAAKAGIIIAAWGVTGTHMDRDRAVERLLGHHHLHALGFTKAGNPRHPLYLKSGLSPLPMP
jgi:hypothetical protein